MVHLYWKSSKRSKNNANAGIQFSCQIQRKEIKEIEFDSILSNAVTESGDVLDGLVEENCKNDVTIESTDMKDAAVELELDAEQNYFWETPKKDQQKKMQKSESWTQLADELKHPPAQKLN